MIDLVKETVVVVLYVREEVMILPQYKKRVEEGNATAMCGFRG